ncbi:hypothetical protein K461DRAFT_20174 [Myriangium duriaei CBS 260.36]|uniref:Uncharacterized protein n=1 Tax=Myriangium duriaei CBS 260.36 TaxID=1168546 RepID=A0A9P4J8Z8_9PEZI|nr:hypothetical protein K461DRAFT_20174 [Myriangium duriaei CBS 260.36]
MADLRLQTSLKRGQNFLRFSCAFILSFHVMLSVRSSLFRETVCHEGKWKLFMSASKLRCTRGTSYPLPKRYRVNDHN